MRNELLFAACGRSWDGTARDEPPDWIYVYNAADRQGVAPLLHDWLNAHPEVDVPHATAVQLQNVYWAQHFRNRILLEELDRLIDAARSGGIDLIPLKGAALAVDYYPKAALRPMSDLDLLVRLEDQTRMADVMRARGYEAVDPTLSYASDTRLDRASREHIWVVQRRALETMVEYRAAAVQATPGRIGDLDATLASALREHTAAVWMRAAPVGDGTRRRLRATAEDLLLQVAAHLAAHHSDFRLIWLHDLAQIVRHAGARLDWAYVSQHAASMRITGAVAASLEAAARWIDAPIPPDVIDRLRNTHDAGSSAAFQKWERRELARHVDELPGADLVARDFAVDPLVSAIGRMRGWRPRVKTLMLAVFPSREYLAHRGARPGVVGYLRALAARCWSAVGRRAPRRQRSESSSSHTAHRAPP